MINIAVDGFSGTGKSTIAKGLAKRLGIKVLDTGALYRAVACEFVRQGLDENLISKGYVEDFAKSLNFKVEFVGDVQHVWVNGVDHTPSLRTEEISVLTSKLSPFFVVREKILQVQRGFAKENDIVMEGRDIGSHVLPDADFKFFVTASDEVRAQRRFDQQKALGNVVDFDEVLKELKERDYRDTHREHGAITIMPDSIVVDTSNQTVDQSVEFCLNRIKSNLLWICFEYKFGKYVFLIENF